MKNFKHYYLVEIQFLGFRYHGWQQQPDMKTVQGTILKVVEELLPNLTPKIFGGSRTDSMVSANKYFLMITVKESEINNIDQFLKQFNDLCPADIKAIKIEKVDYKFNMIQRPKLKEYRYYFCFGQEKPHPFCAPILTHIIGDLDLDLMKKGAELFNGTHNFKKYCFRPHTEKDFVKTLEHCSIELNDFYKANFFPEKSYYLKVVGHSFMRHQIRLMAGTLFRLGLHEITFRDFEESLLGNDNLYLGFIAPGTGLILHDIQY